MWYNIRVVRKKKDTRKGANMLRRIKEKRDEKKIIKRVIELKQIMKDEEFKYDIFNRIGDYDLAERSRAKHIRANKEYNSYKELYS